MKDYVKIQSTTTIHVTPGLQYRDVTNPDAHVPDRLKVHPTWAKCVICITAGVGIYPSEIVEWDSVKALAKCNILTIGDFVDEGGNPEEKELMKEIPEDTERKTTKKSKKTLDEISE